MDWNRNSILSTGMPSGVGGCLTILIVIVLLGVVMHLETLLVLWLFPDLTYLRALVIALIIDVIIAS